jgi:hypothetical protein
MLEASVGVTMTDTLYDWHALHFFAERLHPKALLVQRHHIRAHPSPIVRLTCQCCRGLARSLNQHASDLQTSLPCQRYLKLLLV